MTLLTLATRNVRHHARNYAAFFFSSAFAVWLFFLYGSLLFHPSFSAEVLGELIGTTLTGVEVMVALFAVMFIAYAHSAFLKARQREIGLLTLLGMRPGELARTVHYENMIIGGAATVAGVAIGVVSNKLFFLLIGNLLDLKEPVPFHLSPEAVLITFTMFTLIFALISLLTQRGLGRKAVAAVLREAVKPKRPPVLSGWRAALCLLAFGAAFALAAGWVDVNPNQSLLWVMLLLGVGSFLLIGQAGVGLLRLLQRNRAVYWRHINLITLSQLAYKVRDNARILFMVSMLSTVAMFAVGILYHAYQRSEEQAVRDNPLAVMLVGAPGGLTPDDVAAALREDGVAAAQSARLEALAMRVDSEPRPWLTVPASGFAEWLRLTDTAVPDLPAPGQALLVSWWRGRYRNRTGVTVGGADLEIRSRMEEATVFNHHSLTGTVLVVHDTTFADLAARLGARQSVTLHGFRLADWRDSEGAAERLTAGLAGPEQRDFTATVHELKRFQQQYGITLFLGGFISLLFLLAAGNMLYFKLFTDLVEDRRQFQALFKVGIRPAEIRRVISIQTFLLFFVPLVLASLQATVLLNMVSTWLESNIWPAVWTVIGGYAALFGAYYLVTRRTYAGAVLTGR